MATDSGPGSEGLRDVGERAAMRAIEWSEAVREGREPEPHAAETALVDILTGIYMELWRLSDILAHPPAPPRKRAPRRPSDLQPGSRPVRRLLGWNISYSHGFIPVYGTDEEAAGFTPDIPARYPRRS